MKLFFILPFIVVVLSSCTNYQKQDSTSFLNTVTFHNLYAKGFQIKQLNEDIYQIHIYNPLQESENLSYTYYFSKSGNNENESKNLITSLNNVICLSTTHIAFIEKLHEVDKISGGSNPKYIYSQAVQKKIREGKIKDIGFDQSLNYETILTIKPDLIFIYGVGGENAQFYNKLTELGLKTIFIGEYLEQNPLAKFEWIKLFGLLFNKKELADSLFLSTLNNYNTAMQLIPEDSNLNKPKVLFNLPWKGTWYVPGGKSYLAQMVSLCKGQYIWDDNNSRSTIPLSIETVISKGNDADIWINPGNAVKKIEIVEEDERLRNFRPFKEGEIYNFNKRLNKDGGNDYWESGVVNPHLVLKDLIVILHPEVLPDYEFYYCRKVE